MCLPINKLVQHAGYIKGMIFMQIKNLTLQFVLKVINYHIFTRFTLTPQTNLFHLTQKFFIV